MSSNQNVSNSARRLRSDARDRERSARQPRSERGRVPQGGYELRNRNINFAGKRSTYNPQIILIGGIAVAIIVLLIFFIVSCATSCGNEQVDPTASISEDLQGELRTSVEKVVTTDYQSTYVAEHADLYPQDLIQLMVNEPASTEFVYNYPVSSHEAQAYSDPVSAGSVPLLYNWDARWGYVDYAGSSLAVTGSGPTSLAMARMGLLGNNEMTPATIGSQVTQLGGASGATFMAPTLFGEVSTSDNKSDSDASSQENTVVDEDEDGYDDNTGEYVGDLTQSSESSRKTNSSTSSESGIYKALGLSGELITVEPGTSITDTLSSALDDQSYVLVETTEGAFGSTPHWCLIVGTNDDGSLTVYDPTSVANSLHPWDPGTVVDGSSTLVALSVPQTSSSQQKTSVVDENEDGYDDVTGEYVGDSSDSSSSSTSNDESSETSTSSDESDTSSSSSSGSTGGSTSTNGSSDSSSSDESSSSSSDEDYSYEDEDGDGYDDNTGEYVGDSGNNE